MPLAPGKQPVQVVEAAVLRVDDDDVLDAVELALPLVGVGRRAGRQARPASNARARRAGQWSQDCIGDPCLRCSAPVLAELDLRRAPCPRARAARRCRRHLPPCPSRPIRPSRDRRSRCASGQNDTPVCLYALPSSCPASTRRLALHERRAGGQRDLGDQPAHDLALQRALGDVRRQPAGVLHDQRDLVVAAARVFAHRRARVRAWARSAPAR